MDDVWYSLHGMWNRSTGWCASMPNDINAKFQSTALMFVMNSFLRLCERRKGCNLVDRYQCFGEILTSIFSNTWNSTVYWFDYDLYHLKIFFDSLQGEKYIFLQSAYTGSRTHTASQSMNNGGWLFIWLNTGRDLKMTTHLHIVLGLRISKAILVLPLYNSTFKGTPLPLPYYLHPVEFSAGICTFLLRYH
jgi:hypothetical protein